MTDKISTACKQGVLLRDAINWIENNRGCQKDSIEIIRYPHYMNKDERHSKLKYMKTKWKNRNMDVKNLTFQYNQIRWLIQGRCPVFIADGVYVGRSETF